MTIKIIDGFKFQRVCLEETHHEVWISIRPNGTALLLTRGEQLRGEWAVTSSNYAEPDGVGDTAEEALAAARKMRNMAVMRAMNVASDLEERRDTLRARMHSDLDERVTCQT